MSLTTKGRNTRQRIIEGAALHLRSDDPGDVTLDSIRAVTGTSKSQIFHYFPGGKEDLLLAVAQHESDQVLLDQQPHLGTLTSWAAWERWRDAVVMRYRLQGRNCPMGALLAQLTTTPGAAEVVASLLTQWQREIACGVEAMQTAGKVRRSVDPVRASAAFLTAIQGGVQILRTTGSVVALEQSFDVLLDYLRGD